MSLIPDEDKIKKAMEQTGKLKIEYPWLSVFEKLQSGETSVEIGGVIVSWDRTKVNPNSEGFGKALISLTDVADPARKSSQSATP